MFHWLIGWLIDPMQKQRTRYRTWLWCFPLTPLKQNRCWARCATGRSRLWCGRIAGGELCTYSLCRDIDATEVLVGILFHRCVGIVDPYPCAFQTYQIMSVKKSYWAHLFNDFVHIFSIFLLHMLHWPLLFSGSVGVSQSYRRRHARTNGTFLSDSSVRNIPSHRTAPNTNVHLVNK